VRQGRTEERHDAVAHHLVHGAFVAVDRFHHALENGIEQPASFLGVAIGQELHRGLEVGEEHGDLLALADHGGARGQDLVGEMRGRVGLRRRGVCRRREASSAAVTESCVVGIVVLAGGTRHPFTLPAVSPSTM
jgi:hypothetical protein